MDHDCANNLFFWHQDAFHVTEVRNTICERENSIGKENL